MRFFTRDEFTMQGRNVFDKMDPEFLELLDQCRAIAMVPLKITSSYRSPRYNKAVGGAPGSWHTKGRAVDVACTNGKTRAEIIYAALSVGLSVGIMENAIHLDNREVQICFHYYGKNKQD